MTPGSAGFSLPTSSDEDWRYVDCKPLADAAAAQVGGPNIGDVVGADALPTPTDVGMAWAVAGGARRLAVGGTQHLQLDDRGGAWAMRLDVAPGATIRISLRRHTAVGRSASWLHAVLGRGATLELDDLPATNADVQLATVTGDIAQDARFAVHIAQVGGRLVRHRIEARLAATGADCTITAATSVRGTHQAHMLTRITHAVGLTNSDQLIKAVLRDKSRTSFDGVVTMLKGADGAKAVQQDRNLLLAAGARADTRPQLDIRADEVEANHGATVGSLDEDELIYLRARGLDGTTARNLLTTAFLDEALLCLADPAMRSEAQSLLHAL